MEKKVKQRDFTDCGAACIASVAAYYKLNLPIAKIRQLAFTDKKGTNVLGLVEALQKLGFEAKGVRGSPESLTSIPKPAIAHVIVNDVQYHYVAIYKVSVKSIEYMDPADGKMHKVTYDAFKGKWTGILVILAPGETFRTGDFKFSIGNRFFGLIRPQRPAMIQALVGAIVYSLIGLTTSIYIQKIADYVLVNGNRNLLNLMSVVMIAFLLVQVFIGVCKSVLTLQTGQRIDKQLILGYYKHLLALPQQFFHTMRVGEIVSRINDAVKIRAFVNDAMINILINFFAVVLALALMFTYYWKLGLVVLMVIPFYASIYLITNRLNKAVERKLMENSAELESQLVESLAAIQTIKSFGIEEYTNLKTEGRFITLLKSVYRSGINNIFATHAAEFFSRLYTIILLWMGAGFAIDNEITPGELLSFYALLAYFTGPLSSLIGMNKIIQNAVIAADRLFEIMDLEREKNESGIELTVEAVGNIQFRNVSFKYGTRATIFEAMNLEIHKSKVTAIVGESGSGKSTLVALLQNLYPLQGGHIFIGESDLQYVKTESLRKIVAVVPQHIDLFAGNITDNIALGDCRPDMKKVIAICAGLGVLEFIEKLPDGFNTYLGENGATLSGGQKQRLAIARALYKDPEILILDEATSSLDSSSEDYVQSMIKILRDRQKTVILITHRLRTVFRADRVVVLQLGKVAEEGSHAMLLQNKGVYYNLWKHQLPILNEGLI